MLWQDNFAKALCSPETPAPTEVMRWDGESDLKRFNVYRNNVFVSLTETIENAFPLAQKIVGEEFFRALARHYCQNHLPTSPVMIFYGESFGDFLDDFPPAQQVPYLADIARLEYSLRLSTHAADEPWSQSHNQHLSSDDLLQAHLFLHPSVQWISSSYPLYDLWYFHEHDADHPIGAEPQSLVISRPQHNPIVEILPAGGDDFFSALSAGKSVGQAAEETLLKTPEAPLSELMVFALTLSSKIGTLS